MVLGIMYCPEVIRALKSGNYPMMRMYASGLEIDGDYLIGFGETCIYWINDYTFNERESKKFLDEYPGAKMKKWVGSLNTEGIAGLFDKWRQEDTRSTEE